VWKTVTDFPAYPSIIPELKEAEVEAREGKTATVRFALSLAVRLVTYRLRYTLEPETRLSWEMVDSNTLSGNAGEWQLEPDGEGTRVTYRHEVVFPAWIAWAVTDKAFTEEMEKTLRKFREHIEAGGDCSRSQ